MGFGVYGFRGPPIGRRKGRRRQGLGFRVNGSRGVLTDRKKEETDDQEGLEFRVYSLGFSV